MRTGRLLAAWILAVAAQGAAVWAGGPNVQVDNVGRGNVSLQQNGATTVIHASDRSIINYNRFDIPLGSTVQFVQPGATATVLNRINSATPSLINGNLQANGVVYLVNPAGVIFGNGAHVNTAGIYAAAAHMSDADFLAGRNHFTNATGAVVNNGMIESSRVVLVGQSVANAGTIVAPGGLVAFAAGDDVYVVENNNSLMLKVTGGNAAPKGQAAVENTGSVEAQKVNMVAGDIYGLAVKNAGEVRAKEIALQSKGTTVAEGKLDASSTAAGTKGGTVQVLGETAIVTGQIDASGAAGGGTVYIGGAEHGGGGVQTANWSYVGHQAQIKADALGAGDGGNVVVWSNMATYFYGSIAARGGAAGGNGGAVEVSGPTLSFGGKVDLTANLGHAGTLLLDPATVIVTNGAAGTGTDDAQLSDNTILSTDNGGAGTFTVTNGQIVSLIGAADVVIGAATDISINAGITAVTTHNLVLSAPTIVLNAPISITGGGLLTGNVPPNVNTSVSVNAGGLVQNGVDLLKSGGTLTVAAGSYAEDVSINTDMTLDTSNGAVNLNTLTDNNALILGKSGATSAQLVSTGAMAFNNTVALGADAVFAPGGGITFASTLTGNAHGLTLLGGGIFAQVTGVGAFMVSGTTILNGTVGAASVDFNTVGAGTSLHAGANTITTTGSQTYEGAVDIGADTTFASTGGGTIWFKSTLDTDAPTHHFNVTLNNPAATGQFDGAVGSLAGAMQTITANLATWNLNAPLTTAALTGPVGTVNVTTAAGAAGLQRAQSVLVAGSTVNIAAGTYGGGQDVTVAVASTLHVNGGTLVLTNNLTVNPALTAFTLSGNITTGGTQTYNSPLVLAADSTLASTGAGAAGNISFLNTVESPTTPHALTVNTGGLITITGVVGGGGNPLLSLTLGAGGTTNLGAGAITTTGDQTYNNPITLTSGDTFISNAGGKIWFKNTMDSNGTAQDIAAQDTTGTVQFDAPVGVGAPLRNVVTFNAALLSLNAPMLLGGGGGGSLTIASGTGVTSTGAALIGANVLAAGPITIGGTFTTTGTQTYAALTLSADLTLVSTGAGAAGNITFGSTVQSPTPHALTVNTAGLRTFTGAVGGAGNPLASLVTNGAGTTQVNADVTTTGAQTWSDAVTLTATPITFTSTGAGTMQLVSTLDASAPGGAVTLSIPAGTLRLDGAVGGVGFATVTLDSTALTLNAPITATTLTALTPYTALTIGGAASIQNGVDLLATPGGVLTVNTGTYVGNVTIAKVLTLHSSGGTVTITGNLSDTSALTIGGAFTTSGTQTYAALTLGADTTLTSTGIGAAGAITFNGTVDPPTAHALVVSTAGTTTFSAAVGTLSSLTVGSGTTAFGAGVGTVTTTGAQSYQAVTLAADTVFTGSLVTMPTTVSAAGFRLDIQGAASLGGAVTAGAVTVSGASTLAGTTITTTLGQTYTGPVTLGASIVFTDTGGANIAFGSILPSTIGLAMTTNTNGTTNLGGGIGGGIPLASLTTTAGTVLLGGTFDVNAQSYAAATLTSATTLNGANVTFSGPVTGAAFPLMVSANVVFGGAVNVSSLFVGSLYTVTINAPSIHVSSDIALIGPSVFLGATTIISTSTGQIWFNSITSVESIGGTFGLTLDAAHDIYMGGSIGGGGHPLDFLTITSSPRFAFWDSSVTTVHGQTYGKTFALSGGNGTPVFTSTAGSDILFTAPIQNANSNSPTSLSIVTSGLTTFAASIGDTDGQMGAFTVNNVVFGATVSVRSLTANGTTAVNGGGITTSAGQTYASVVTVGANATFTDTGGVGITFNGPITGNTAAMQVRTSGGLVGSGPNIGSPIGADVIFNSSVDVGSLNVVSLGNIIAHNVTAHAASGGITLTPNLTLIPAIVSGGHLVAEAAISPVTFFYAPGQLLIEGNLTAGPGGTVHLGGANLPSAPELTRSNVPGIATIMVIPPSSAPLTITGTNVEMGQNERMVVAISGTKSGSLTITATTATLGDITALDALRINASTVTFLQRPAGYFLLTPQILTTQTLGGDPFVGPDGAVSFVAGNTLEFNGVGTFNNLGGVSPVGFATSNGVGGSGVPGLVRAYDLAATATSLPLSSGSAAVVLKNLRSGVPADLTLTFTPLLGTGPSIINPSSSLANVLPQQLPSPVASLELSGSDIKALRDIGIDPRELDAAEQDALQAGGAVFNDVPDERGGFLVHDAGMSSLKVAVGRLPVTQTRELLDAFRNLFSEPEMDATTGKPLLDANGQMTWKISPAKRKAVAGKIEAGWKAFRANAKDAPATGAEFRKYLEKQVADTAAKDTGERDALATLTQLQALYGRLDRMGLTGTELRKARNAIFKTVADPSVQSSRGDPLNDQVVLEGAAGAQPISLGLVGQK